MKIKVSKYSLWIALFCFAIAFILYYIHVFSTNYYPELKRFEDNFRQKEIALESYVKNVAKDIQKSDFKKGLKNEETPFFLHIYRNDTLIYWNTNKIPVNKFADLHFPTSGINKIHNGWYYVSSQKVNNTYTITGSFLIKNEYSYQNDYLKNDFVKPFKENFQSHISLDEASGYPIFSKKKQYLFSVVVNGYQPASKVESLILMGLLIMTIFLLLWQLSIYCLKPKWGWLFPLFIIGIRFLSLKFEWFSFLQNTELFSASLYGTSSVFPNFFEYTLNVFLIFIIVQFVYTRSLQTLRQSPIFLSYFLLLIPYPTWLGVTYLFKGLVENSSIPMSIGELFTLNIYSLITVFTIAIIGFSFFLICKTVYRYVYSRGVKFQNVILINSLGGIFFFLFGYLSYDHILYTSLFPFVFTSVVAFLEYKNFKQKHLILGTFMLALYASVCAFSIGEFNNRKDKSERELYASQLMIERDITTEVEYNKLGEKLMDDKFLQRLISLQKQYDNQDFEELMELRYFNGFWEKYECHFFLFNVNNQSILSLQNNSDEVYNNLIDVITYHSQQSEINPALFFIKDYYGQYSYIIKQPLYGKNSEAATMFVTLKSKKIPEEIGFPRLLLSSKASALKHLENYSIAKYHKNKLVSKYGAFNYPTTFNSLKKHNANNLSSFNYNNYNHIVHFKSKDDVVVLSGINTNWIDDLTSFSYLFCFFGLLLLPYYLRFYSNSFFKSSLSLSFKLQFSLLGIVAISLIISGISSGFFIQNQYREYSELAVREKTHSIELELKPIVSKLSRLKIAENGSLLNYQLTNLSKVYNTDINIYDTKGYLISTSRQNVFNLGLLSEQINPIARKKLAQLEQSEFLHNENIGSLKYLSAYSPLYNKNGQILGYINLQHFGQQEEVEHQVQRFLVSIINIFVLLLAISIIVAIYTSNWITTPLQTLQERFSKLHLGRANQQIEYNQDDEIGALVKSYNEKIKELEFAAQELAKSERESAWRDMAKQVAHEIKNPLTPMKLSVQHLMRSFDPNNPSTAEQINRVSQSLIEQIDSLTKIANEFSNFAKMSKLEFEPTDLVKIINNSTELFKQSSNVLITSELPHSLIVMGDKEQLLRVFNNLIKNAIQALSSIQNGEINIKLSQDEKEVTVAISDNGIGISEEVKQKIFTPYFTTKSTGSGIGLAMVKQIIVSHNGDIHFESEQNKGTTFYISLPKMQA